MMKDLSFFIHPEEFTFSSVIVPVIKSGGEPRILFEVRESHLSQPGQVCFPGGHIMEGEPPLSAAVRETEEELLISRDQLSHLRFLGLLYTPSGMIIHAYTGELAGYRQTYSAHEVADVFTVPVSFFLEHPPLESNTRVILDPAPDFPCELIPGGADYVWREGRYPVFFYSYEGHIIWGITAKILREFIRRRALFLS